MLGMHSVDLLEEALQLAMNSGFEIRQEWMKEQGGGACRIGHRWILFVDLSLSAQEQLEQVIKALRETERYKLNSANSQELSDLLTSA